MKKSSKILSLFLVFIFMGVLFTACGNSTAPTQVADTTAAGVTIAADAPTQKELAPVELKWYLVGGEQKDKDMVLAEMNKIIRPEINATLDTVTYDWDSYEQKMQLLIASGDSFDLCFTSSWIFNYLQSVSKGAFVAIDSMMNEYAPNATKQIPENVWKTVKVKGKTYGFPNYQIEVFQDAIAVQKKYVDKYNFDITKVKKIQDLEPLLVSVAQNDKGVYPIDINSSNQTIYFMRSLGIEELAGTYMPGAIYANDKDAKVINQYESQEVKDLFTTARSWYLKGLWRKDAATVSDTTADRKTAKNVVEIEGTYKPGGLAEMANSMDLKPEELVEIKFGSPYLSSVAAQAGLTAISSSCKNPERAMMFLERINTDKTLYNLLCHGIEGTHYKKVGTNTVEEVENTGYAPGVDWEYGCQFNGFYRPGQEEGTWELTAQMNQAAQPSPVLGFSFDPEAVKVEISQCQAVIKEYIPILLTGSADPTSYLPQFLDKLKASGSDKIIQEMQKQIDEYKKTV